MLLLLLLLLLTELGLWQVLIHSWQQLSASVAGMATSASDPTPDVLLNHLRDSDLPTILSSMADRLEPYSRMSVLSEQTL